MSENPRDEVFKMNANRIYAFANDFVQMPEGTHIQCVECVGRKFINAADTAGEEGAALFQRDLVSIIDGIRGKDPNKTIGIDITGYSGLGLGSGLPACSSVRFYSGGATCLY